MNRLFVLVVSVILNATTFSQSPVSSGKIQANAGLGLTRNGVPVYFGFDYGFKKTITLGGEAFYSNFNERYNYSNYNISMLGITANGNWHFNGLLPIPESVNIYTGLSIGYYNWIYPSNYMENNLSSVRLGIQIGGRYFFNSKFALNFELNSNPIYSGSKFGLTYKL